MIFSQMKTLLDQICFSKGEADHLRSSIIKVLDDYNKLGVNPVVPPKRKIDCLIGLNGYFIREGQLYSVDMKEDDFEWSFDDVEIDRPLKPNEYNFDDPEKVSVAIESKWGIVNYTVLPFDDRRHYGSGLLNVIDEIGVYEALEEYRELIDRLFEKFKNEYDESYIVLAFSFSSQQDYCGEWDYYINIEGLYDFKLGCVVAVPD